MTQEQFGTNRDKTEVIGGIKYSMLGPDQKESREWHLVLTKNSGYLNLEEYDEKEGSPASYRTSD